MSSFLDDLLNRARSTIQNAGNYIQQDFQRNPIVQGAIVAPKIAQNIIQNPQVQRVGTNIGQSIFNAGKQYLPEHTPLRIATNAVEGLYNPDPTSYEGKYVRGNIVKPATEGLDTYNKGGLSNRAGGLLQLGGAAFSSTPFGALTNIGTGTAAAIGNTLRNRSPLLSNILKDTTKPISFGEEGLGLQGLPALAVDLLAGNPKEAISSLKNIKNISKLGAVTQYNKGMHPEDIKEATGAITVLRQQLDKSKFLNPQDFAKNEEMVRMLAAHYIDKSFGNSKKTTLQDAVNALTERVHVDTGLYGQVKKGVGMGLVGDKPVAETSLVSGMNKPVNPVDSSSFGEKKDTSMLNQTLTQKIPEDLSKGLPEVPLQSQVSKSSYNSSIAQPNNPIQTTGKAVGKNVVDNLLNNGTPIESQGLTKQIGKDILPNDQLNLGAVGTNVPAGNKSPLGQVEQGLSKEAQLAPSPLDTSISQRLEPKPQELNVNNLNLSPEQKAEMYARQGSEIKQKLGDNQILEIAKNAGIDTKTHSIDETAQKIAEQLNQRRDVVSLQGELESLRKANAPLEEVVAKIKQIDEASRISSEQGTDLARQLRARSILANELDTPMQRVFKLLQKAGINPEKYTQEAAKVDFSDANQVIEFYRKLVPAKASDWIDVLRYNSMLSSPNTHINNIFSNAVNTSVVAPIEKTLTGTLDFLGSKLTGKQQTQFAGEGLAYSKGYVSSLSDASHAFADVMRGKNLNANQDIKNILVSNKGKLGQVGDKLSYPTKLLEAADQFFTKLTEGGERSALNLRVSKGVDVSNIESQAQNNAKYRLFRSDLKDPRQGVLLNGIDEFTAAIEKVRNSKNIVASTIAKFTLPFIRTPMNIFKQGIEYSPVGIATLPGAINKTEQLSKALIGTSAVAGSMMLISSGRTTWAEPTDPAKKAAFRAAGLQPYAVKIGDNWVGYSKLPPALGFPLAFLSAIHDADKNKTIDQNQLDVLLTAAAKYGNFFSDQSYMKNIGDLVTASKGSPEAMSQFISNYPQQLIPYRALLGWMARLTDPYQRKVNQDANFLDKQVQQLFTQIPGLSQTVPARMDATGSPIPNQNKELNAFSPVRVTTEKPDQKQFYDMLQQKSLNNKNIQVLKDKVSRGEDITFDQVAAAEKDSSLSPMELMKKKAELDVAKTKVELLGKPIDIYGKHIYVDDLGSVHTEDIAKTKQKQKKDSFELQTAQTDLLTQRAERANNFPLFVSSLQDQVKALQDYQKTLDPETDKKEILTKQNTIEDIQAKIDKYKSYGGFTKPKKGKKIKALSLKPLGTSIKYSSPKNVSRLDRILASRSPSNGGLRSIQSILDQSEKLTKTGRGKAIQQVLGA